MGKALAIDSENTPTPRLRKKILSDRARIDDLDGGRGGEQT
jgi:hypothetical protein